MASLGHNELTYVRFAAELSSLMGIGHVAHVSGEQDHMQMPSHGNSFRITEPFIKGIHCLLAKGQ